MFFLIMQSLYLLVYSAGVASVKNVSLMRFYNNKVLIYFAAPTAGIVVADFRHPGTLLNKPI